MRKFPLISVLAALLLGCASQSATLVNDRGEKRYCYREGSGGIGSGAAATREYNRCLNDAGAAGFRRAD